MAKLGRPKKKDLTKEKELALNDFFYFAKNILGYKDISPQPHQELCDFLVSDDDRKLILLPRGSFKSSIATIAYTIWQLVKNPNIRILIITENFNNSTKYLGNIKNQIEQNLTFIELFGVLRPKNIGQWKRDDITITTRTDCNIKEPSVSASSILQTKVGMHYDLIIMDDVVSNNNTGTPEQIQKVIDSYRLILSLPDPGGKLIIIGTRYHYNDLYGHLIETEADSYKTLIRKAIDANDNLYFPTRLTKNFLEKMKRSQGSVHYSNQYLNEPIDSETAVFRREWMLFYDELPNNLRHFILTDAAASIRKSADFSVVLVVGVDEHSNIYIIDPWQDRVTLSNFIDKIFEYVEKYNVHKEGIVTIETNAFQQVVQYAILEEMNKRKFYFGIKETKPDSTNSKDRRIKSLQPLFENGRIFFNKNQTTLIEQITRYPKTRYDDLIDALSDIVQVMVPADPIMISKEDSWKINDNDKRIWSNIDKNTRSVKRIKKRV